MDFSDDMKDAVWEKKKPYYTSLLGSGDGDKGRDICGAEIHKDQYGRQTEFGWEIDHIKPISKGGTDDLSNLQPLHWENNSAKSDKIVNLSDKAWCKIRSDAV